MMATLKILNFFNQVEFKQGFEISTVGVVVVVVVVDVDVPVVVDSAVAGVNVVLNSAVCT